MSDVIFRATRLPKPHRQESGVPFEHLRTLRQLRRLGHPGAHQLGGEVRQGRRGRDHLVVRARVHPRAGSSPTTRRSIATSAFRSGARSARRCTRTTASSSCSSVTAAGSATFPTSRIPKGQSSTDKKDPLHGFECDRMTIADIKEVVAAFAEGARRARDAGLDGVELHGANGYLITQFLSSAINDRNGRVRRIAREPRALRPRHRRAPFARGSGRDFHLQMKISAVDHNNALLLLQTRRSRQHRRRSRCRSASGSWTPASTRFTCPPAAPSRIRATLPAPTSTSRCWPTPTSSWPRAARTPSAICCSSTTI